MSTPSAKGQYIGCDVIPCDPATATYTHGSFDATGIHPLFPGCKFYVQWSLAICPDGTLYFKITDFYLDGKSGTPSVACDGLRAWLITHPQDYQIILEKLVDQVAMKYFNQSYAVNPNSLKCPLGKLTMYSFAPKCTEFCGYQDTRPVEVGGGKEYIVPSSCYQGECCQVKHVICFDDATGTVVDTKTVTRIGTLTLCNNPNNGGSCPSTFGVQTMTGGTYQVALSSSFGCYPNSCNIE